MAELQTNSWAGQAEGKLLCTHPNNNFSLDTIYFDALWIKVGNLTQLECSHVKMLHSNTVYT